MEKNTKVVKEIPRKIEGDFFELLWERSWTYVKTVVDVVREPMLILDENLRVMAANESFYKTFNVIKKETEGKIMFKLGNGQWNIPIFKKLIKDVATKHTFFKGFQVAHNFPAIGRKVMILNARQIHIVNEAETGVFPPITFVAPPIILVAMEDVTDMMVVSESLSKQAAEIESKMAARTKTLEIHIGKLEKEISNLKKKK
jgi:hypothetical protein